MPSPDTIALIARIKDGDKAAWDDLCARYYPEWLARLHGELGRDLRSVYSTEDILQSAVAEALRDVNSLTDETKFYAWFNTIQRRKIIEKRRKLDRSPNTVGHAAVERASADSGEVDLATDEEYGRVLDAVLVLFPQYPEHMSAFSLKHLEGLDLDGLKRVFQRSERWIYDLLARASDLVRSKLAAQLG